MKKWIIAVINVFVVLAAAFAFIMASKANVVGKVIEENENFSVSKVVFKGAEDKDIYGLFFIPNKEEYNVIIVLPGAEGSKESRRFYAEMLLEMGYGALILDQRGIGETDGEMLSFADDLYAFTKREGTNQILMALDTVKAAGFLKNVRGVKNIAVLGESMGGRTAIIATALNETIKGTIVISSAGLFGSLGNDVADQYLSFINPNSYIGKISPRRILMLHSVNDTVIPLGDAQRTFSFAKEPKKFVQFSNPECIHGYCKPMKGFIRDELEMIFS